MATNQDFNDLIARINAATSTLEATVAALDDGREDLEQSVIDAQAAAQEAVEQAVLATESAQDSAQALADALEAVDAATLLVEQLQASVVLDDAPKDGNQYVRQNGQWTVNSGGGLTPVLSVNGNGPDATGNVQLTIPAQVQSDWTATSGPAFIKNKPTLFDGNYNSLTNKPALFSGRYQDLTNKPTIPQQGVLSVVAGSNITVDNTDPLNPVVSSSGGGGGSSQGFATGVTNIDYGPDTFTHWPHTNPHKPAELAQLGAYVTGSWLAGGRLLTDVDGFLLVPEGWYYFKRADFGSVPTGWPATGVLFVGSRGPLPSSKFAIAYSDTLDVAPSVWISSFPASGYSLKWAKLHS